MHYYLNQNLRIIIAAISVFVLSLSMGLIIYGHSHEEAQKVSVINIEEVQKSPVYHPYHYDLGDEDDSK